jgi:hypothetical protein
VRTPVRVARLSGERTLPARIARAVPPRCVKQAISVRYVNDRTGTLRISHSTLHDNPSVGSETAGYRGIFFLGKGHPIVVHSTIN